MATIACVVLFVSDILSTLRYGSARTAPSVGAEELSVGIGTKVKFDCDSRWEYLYAQSGTQTKMDVSKVGKSMSSNS
jgi:hypothetical protein